MPLAVADGALIQCTFGTMPAVLRTSHHVEVNGHALATVDDHVPVTNIGLMGSCFALQLNACAPVTNPWLPGTEVRINGKQLIDATATCACNLGGIVQILHPATTVTIGREPEPITLNEVVIEASQPIVLDEVVIEPSPPIVLDEVVIDVDGQD